MSNIYLIGYMGSGKSTIGRKLARRLKYRFLDLDKHIVSSNGRTIPQIFDEDGETGFREIERIALLDTLDMENMVVGTGGGTPCFFDNITQIKQHGTSVYLRTSVETLTQRLLNSKTRRPLIEGKTAYELQNYIRKHLTDREVFYMQADHIVEAGNLKINAMIDLVYQNLKATD